MAKPTRQSGAVEIPEDRWNAFFREFTGENLGAHGRLEMMNLDDVGREVGLENRPFQGISADTKGSDTAIWITFGTTPNDHFAHGIHGAKSVRWLRAEGDRGAVLEIVDRDGTKTILTLSPPQEFALSEAD
jgi:hypothetical protein